MIAEARPYAYLPAPPPPAVCRRQAGRRARRREAGRRARGARRAREEVVVRDRTGGAGRPRRRVSIAPHASDARDDPPRFDVSGKIALVTGAARGLGRACAIALAQAGADVALGLRDARAGGGTRRRDPRARPARAAAADGRHARAPRSTAAVAEAERDVRPHRHPGQQRRHRSAQPRRGGHRGRLRSHAGRQPQGDVLRQPGGGTGDDPPGRRRAHRQPRLAGRRRRAADRVGLLHDQGGDRAPDQVPRRRVGAPRHQRQRRRADLHPHARER